MAAQLYDQFGVGPSLSVVNDFALICNLPLGSGHLDLYRVRALIQPLDQAFNRNHVADHFAECSLRDRQNLCGRMICARLGVPRVQCRPAPVLAVQDPFHKASLFHSRASGC
jgi:hypothetical protein